MLNSQARNAYASPRKRRHLVDGPRERLREGLGGVVAVVESDHQVPHERPGIRQVGGLPRRGVPLLGGANAGVVEGGHCTGRSCVVVLSFGRPVRKTKDGEGRHAPSGITRRQRPDETGPRWRPQGPSPANDHTALVPRLLDRRGCWVYLRARATLVTENTISGSAFGVGLPRLTARGTLTGRPGHSDQNSRSYPASLDNRLAPPVGTGPVSDAGWPAGPPSSRTFLQPLRKIRPHRSVHRYDPT